MVLHSQLNSFPKPAEHGGLVLRCPDQVQEHLNITELRCQVKFNIFEEIFMLPSEIVEYIENILKQKGISKTTFFSSCNLSAAVMSNWRKNKNYPSMQNLLAINEFLGTRFGIAIIEEKTAPVEDGLSDLQRALIKSAATWSDRTIVLAMQIANELEASRNHRDDS